MEPQDIFGQGSRYLAHLEFSFNGTPQKALLFLFPMALTPLTFLNSFPSYPTFSPTSQEENSENGLKGAFIQSARPLARLGFGRANIFLGVFFLLFPTASTPFTSSNSFLSYSTFRWLSQWIMTG